MREVKDPSAETRDKIEELKLHKIRTEIEIGRLARDELAWFTLSVEPTSFPIIQLPGTKFGPREHDKDLEDDETRGFLVAYQPSGQVVGEDSEHVFLTVDGLVFVTNLGEGAFFERKYKFLDFSNVPIAEAETAGDWFRGAIASFERFTGEPISDSVEVEAGRLERGT